MKNYREIADSVFARRDQYVIAQRKKKQVVARATGSVGSVALVSLAGFALWGNDAFHDTPPVTDGGVTTTAAPTGAETTTATTAPFATTDGDSTDTTTVTDAPTQTATTVTTRPSASHTVKTEPSKTTAPTQTTTTTPKKQLIGASEPDTYSVDNANEGPGYFKRGEISPMLKKKMETHKDENVVFAVLVAVMPKFNADEIDKAVSEFCETEEMRKLAEENNWQEYHNRVHDLREVYYKSVLKVEIDVLRELSEIEPIKHIPEPVDGQDYPETWPKPPSYVVALANYSLWGHHIYSVVLSADAIYELSERGSYMFWLDSPDTIKEKIPLMFDD